MKNRFSEVKYIDRDISESQSVYNESSKSNNDLPQTKEQQFIANFEEEGEKVELLESETQKEQPNNLPTTTQIPATEPTLQQRLEVIQRLYKLDKTPEFKEYIDALKRLIKLNA